MYKLHSVQKCTSYSKHLDVYTCKSGKEACSIGDMLRTFAFITSLHVFSHDIQSISTFTRVKVAKKPALLCKMFSGFVVIGFLHVFS